MPLVNKIQFIEQRLERRRALATQHLQDVADDVHEGVETARKWVPLAMVGALAIIAFTVARRGGGGARASLRPSRRHLAPAPEHPLTAIAGFAGTMLQIALSPPIRQLWGIWASRRRKQAAQRERAEEGMASTSYVAPAGDRFESDSSRETILNH